MNWKPGDHAVIAFYPQGEFIGRACEVLAIHLKPLCVIMNSRWHRWLPPIVELQVDGKEFPTSGYLSGWTPHKGYGCRPEWLRRPDADEGDDSVTQEQRLHMKFMRDRQADVDLTLAIDKFIEEELDRG